MAHHISTIKMSRTQSHFKDRHVISLGGALGNVYYLSYGAM